MVGPRTNDSAASSQVLKEGVGGPTRGWQHHDVMARGHRMVMAAETWLTPTTRFYFILFYLFKKKRLGKSEGC